MATSQTLYAYPTNLEWIRHPILNGPCMIQVQYGDTTLVHFGELPEGHDPLVYDGVMHQHIFAGEPFWYHGTEQIWCRTFANNVSGIFQRSKLVCSRLLD